MQQKTDASLLRGGAHLGYLPKRVAAVLSPVVDAGLVAALSSAFALWLLYLEGLVAALSASADEPCAAARADDTSMPGFVMEFIVSAEELHTARVGDNAGACPCLYRQG
ncbi:hypothetical protein JKP88DRAFT_273607 [Tribonema minus]|uniref:Uncharacterized protein n=1 Tax=Tribonema minus TaxID=303371 RepID=A0A835YSC5_9STRA|nr:hypothetical protein JKP88DRAFT_273607 [Tribonema minus]